MALDERLVARLMALSAPSMLPRPCTEEERDMVQDYLGGFPSQWQQFCDLSMTKTGPLISFAMQEGVAAFAQVQIPELVTWKQVGTEKMDWAFHSSADAALEYFNFRMRMIPKGTTLAEVHDLRVAYDKREKETTAADLEKPNPWLAENPEQIKRPERSARRESED